MTKIEIKNRFTGSVIFSHEQKYNSIKITLELAVKSGASLSEANLSMANLSEADLSWANLSEADLSEADLSWADLSEADLSRADLSWANLSEADLSEADLSWANLYRADLSWANLSRANLFEANLLCTGDMKFIFTMRLDTWAIGFTKDVLQIGCQKHNITKWKEFSDDDISTMDKKALSWWKRWKEPLFAIIDERLKDL